MPKFDTEMRYDLTVKEYCEHRVNEITNMITKLNAEKDRLGKLRTQYMNSSLSIADLIATRAENLQNNPLPE